MSTRRFLLDWCHMLYAFTKTCTPNSCPLHRKQQWVMLFLNKFLKSVFAHVVSLETQNERREFCAVCFLCIHSNTVIEQIVLLFRTYSYKWKQFVALPYCVTLQTTEHRIPILNWWCSYIVDCRRKEMLLYLISTSAILVLSTGIGIFLWRNNKWSLKYVSIYAFNIFFLL